MESNFSTVLVQDPRLLVVDNVKYAVEKGAANITQSIFNANSASMSQIMFNVAVPSENVIIDRKMLITSTVSVIITVNDVAAGESILNIGHTDGFQAFPLSSLFSTLSATINNTTVSSNVAEILAPLLLMNEKEELYKYHGTTPCLPDAYYLSYDPLNANYSTTTSTLTNTWSVSSFGNNVLGAYDNNSLNTDFISRGSFPFTITQVQLIGGGVYEGQNAFTQIRRATAPGNYQVYLSATFTEPLLLSPFLFGDPSASPQGFYGIQNFTITANIGNANKFWSTANPDLSIQLNPTNTFVNTKLIMQFLTPQPSQLLKSRNVVPFYSLPRYLSVGNSIPALNPSQWNPSNSTAGSPFPGLILSPQTITSSTLALNMIPDKLIICVRPQFAQQGPITSNSFLTITNISISFNNSAGLLSSYSAYDLWRISVKNGSTQTWDSFCGFAMCSTALGLYPVPTTGSLLVLSFGEDIQINDWLAPGSLGNYSLSFNITVANQSLIYVASPSTQIPGGTCIGFNGTILPSAPNTPAANAGVITPEILTITMNSGVFVCDRGTSSVYEGLLSKQDVLDASQQAPYTRNDIQRLIGGSIHDRLKSSVGYLMHKKGHHHSHKVGGSMGASVSGGSMGASVSGGAIHHHSKIHRHVK
jgi:hypothetical protein